MTPPEFPASRVLTGWLNHLSRAGPVTALAFGSVTLTWIEAGSREITSPPSDSLLDSVLRALALRETASAIELDHFLHLGPSRLTAVLREAVRMSLAVRVDEDLYRLRPPDERPKHFAVRRQRAAIRNGVRLPLHDPGPFVFSNHATASGPGARAWPHDSLASHGFDPPATNDPDAWRAVPLMQSETMSLALALCGATLSAYRFRASDRPLADESAFQLGEAASREAFPELFTEPPQSDMTAAWIAWARSRSLPPNEIHDCKTSLDHLQLRVASPPRLENWLRTNRADVFAGETWLWIGDGPLRRATVLTIQSAVSDPLSPPDPGARP